MEAARPTIHSFSASPAAVALRGQSVLAWGVAGAERCVIEPGSIAVDPVSGTLSAVTLSWETAWATGCSIDQGVGAVPQSGSFVVAPQQSTTYTLSARGFQPATRSVTVAVA